MILLLDANALIWSLTSDAIRARPARDSIADPANAVLVSAATVWEIAIKRASGKLGVPPDMRATLDAMGFDGIPVTIEDAERAAALPAHHRDPFDRMLIAQAQRLDAVVVTRDRAFASYDVKVLPA
jgi:PIN domain nuclease of toxin-antitoxin system